MDHGAILVEGTPRELISTLGGEHVVEFEARGGAPAGDELLGLPAVSRVDSARMASG
jgi:hypothetical protein